MMKIKGNIRGMVYASAIAAIYVVLTLVSAAAGLSGGVIQFRLSEALTVLPVFTGRRGSGAVHRVRNSKSRHRRAAVGRGHRISCDADRRIPDIQVPEQA